MYPRRSNTKVKGGPLGTHPHISPDNEPVSHTHPHTHSATHTRKMYIMYKHTDPGFPLSLLADCPPRGVMG